MSKKFYVDEKNKRIKGSYVSVSETIRGFKEILEGKHDNVPEDAFRLTGTIDDVLEKAKEMMK